MVSFMCVRMKDISSKPSRYVDHETIETKNYKRAYETSCICTNHLNENIYLLNILKNKKYIYINQTFESSRREYSVQMIDQKGVGKVVKKWCRC